MGYYSELAIEDAYHEDHMFPSAAAKGHDTYDLYHDDSGRMTKAYGHPGNAGFEGWKYY